MEKRPFPPLQISPYWQHVQDDLVEITNRIPHDKFNWTPKPELWNSRGIILHIAGARDQWLTNFVRDGDPDPLIWRTARTKADLTRELSRTFERVERFIVDEAQLDRTYVEERFPDRPRSGHWIAFSLLEHDIHHRAELLQRLALLDIPHGIDI